MSHQWNSAEILFKEEDAADVFCDEIERQLRVCTPDLNKALRNMGASICESESECLFEEISCYRQIVKLNFNSDKGNCEQITNAFFHLGAQLIKLYVSAEEFKELILLAGGKRVKNAKNI